MNKVYNGPFGKLIRTIGYLAILVGSALLAIKSLKLIDVEFINNLINPVNDFLSEDLVFLIDYSVFFLFAGLILLLWTQSKSYFGRIFITLVTVAVALVVENIVLTDVNIFPFLPEIGQINNLLGSYFDSIKYLQLIQVLPLLMIFILLGSKKPKRTSTTTVSNGLMLLLLSVVIVNLSMLLDNDWETVRWFIILTNSFLSLSFVMIAFGSVFGFLGMFRK